MNMAAWLPSIEEVLEEHAGAPEEGLGSYAEESRASAGNRLLAGHMDALNALSARIGDYAVLLGRAGERGFENPAVTLVRMVKCGEYDEMTSEDYDALYDSVDEISLLWEGQRRAEGTALACNALLHAVLEDPLLFELARARAEEWLSEQGEGALDLVIAANKARGLS